MQLPGAIVFMLYNPRFHQSYRFGPLRRIQLARRMYRNTRELFTGTSWKAHLAMAVKLLELPPSVEGVVVECGCFRGGSTANLSLVCELVGRRLVVYDSFEGLPAPERGDAYATEETEGAFSASLAEVRANVERLGRVEVCEFRRGWFAETLPAHSEPIVLAFLDVDYQASLRECVLNLWPKLTERGYVFIDEYVLLDYCALFWSERFWRETFGTTPPGLIGAGSGVAVGEHYIGPYEEMLPIQMPNSVAYTRKDLSGHWTYYPEESDG